MKKWKEVKSCPKCGGQLEVSVHLASSMDYKLRKDGKIGKRYTVSEPSPIDCVTAFCYGCGRAFDADMVSADFCTGVLEMKLEEENED